MTDFSAKSSFHCTLFYAATMGLSGIELYLVKTISLQFDWTKIYEKGLDSCYIEVMYKGGINVWMTEWFFFTVELNTFTLYCQSVHCKTARKPFLLEIMDVCYEERSKKREESVEIKP